jgi:hypothetical protein
MVSTGDLYQVVHALSGQYEQRPGLSDKPIHLRGTFLLSEFEVSIRSRLAEQVARLLWGGSGGL